MLKTAAGPVLFGDLLTTAKGDWPELKTPTLGVITRGMLPQGSDWSPFDLAPKLAIIHDRLAIGWSGKKWAGYKLIEGLLALPVDEIDEDDYPKKIYDLMLSAASEPDCEDSQLFACLRRSSNAYNYLHSGEVSRFKSKSQGVKEGFAAGSGANAFCG